MGSPDGRVPPADVADASPDSARDATLAGTVEAGPEAACTTAMIDQQTAFPDTPAEEFWTSSPLATGSSVYRWGVYFGRGEWLRIEASGSYRVRCVQ
jgi:hypothetical protein